MGIRRLKIFLGGVGCEPHGQEMGAVGIVGAVGCEPRGQGMGAAGIMGVMGAVGAVGWEPHGQEISEGLGEALRFRYKYNCLSCYDYSLFSMVL